MKIKSKKKSSVVIASEHDKEADLGFVLTVKKLKEIVANLDDDLIVCTHRVEDFYFKKHNWKTLKAIWEKQSLSPEELKEEEKYLEIQDDKSLTAIEEFENKYGIMYSYVDVMPSWQGFVTEDKYGRKLFLITPHY